MNAPAKIEAAAIDIGPGYDRLADAMRAEGIYQVRHYAVGDQFTVEMRDGRTGQGKTIRQAVETASHGRLAA